MLSDPLIRLWPSVGTVAVVILSVGTGTSTRVLEYGCTMVIVTLSVGAMVTTLGPISHLIVHCHGYN